MTPARAVSSWKWALFLLLAVSACEKNDAASDAGMATGGYRSADATLTSDAGVDSRDAAAADGPPSDAAVVDVAPDLFRDATADRNAPDAASGADAVAGADVVASIVRCAPNAELPVAPLRRLTNIQYRRSLRDIAGISVLSAVLPPDSVQNDFEGRAALQTPSALLVSAYDQAALEVATVLGGRLATVLECDPAVKGEAVCAALFIDRFGRRVFRRPMAPAEAAGYTTLYNTARIALPFRGAIETVIRALLQSANFLYRPEVGRALPTGGTERVALSDFEIATRLSYLIWGSTPDDILLAAAGGGKLSTSQGVATEARRLLADARAKEGVKDFFRQWWGIERVGKVASGSALATAVIRSAAEEAYRFIDDAIFSGAATTGALLGAGHTFVNADLAPLYGVAGPASGWARVALDPLQRAGVLTQPWFLAANAWALQADTSPTRRGLFVRERLLCQPVPAPPPQVPSGIPPMTRPDQTLRERLAIHMVDPSCAGCHRMIDPIGFLFEHYDALGRYRATEGGKPLDSSGEIFGSADLDGRLPDAVALAKKLSSSQQVRSCLVRRWYELSAGRTTEPVDQCRLDELDEALRAAGGNLKELLVAISGREEFLFRPAGGLPAVASAPVVPTGAGLREFVVAEFRTVALRLPMADRERLLQHMDALRDLPAVAP